MTCRRRVCTLTSVGLVVFALDLDRLVAFYTGVLGLGVVERDETYALIGDDLVVQQIPPAYADDIEMTVPPVLREDTPFKPVFDVSDLDAAVAAAGRLGGGSQPDDRRWRWRGRTVLDGWDPEGNVIQLRDPS